MDWIGASETKDSTQMDQVPMVERKLSIAEVRKRAWTLLVKR